MSVNCMRCIKNKRTGSDLLCDECRKELATFELCQRCGNRYSEIWEAPDNLWKEIMNLNDGSGLCCLSCFNQIAENRGIALKWSCEDMKALKFE